MIFEGYVYEVFTGFRFFPFIAYVVIEVELGVVTIFCVHLVDVEAIVAYSRAGAFLQINGADGQVSHDFSYQRIAYAVVLNSRCCFTIYHNVAAIFVRIQLRYYQRINEVVQLL